jgi:hypothetical protein
LEIILVGLTPFRLKEKLVMIVVRENTEFILDAGTIAGTPSADQSVEERGIIESGTKDIMHQRIRMQDITVHLRRPVLDRGTKRKEGKLVGMRIAFLAKEAIRVNRGDIDTRGSTGLHPVRPNPEGNELLGQSV